MGSLDPLNLLHKIPWVSAEFVPVAWVLVGSPSSRLDASVADGRVIVSEHALQGDGDAQDVAARAALAAGGSLQHHVRGGGVRHVCVRQRVCFCL